MGNEAEEIWRILNEIARRQKETDEEIRKMAIKTDKEIEKVNKMVGRLTSGWGKFVEGLVEPSGIKLVRDLGVDIKRVLRRTKAFWNEKEIEVDIIIEGERNGKKTLLVIDVKSDYQPSDMRHFLNWFRHFFDYFDIYRDYEVLVAMAAGRFGNGVEANALRRGFWVMTPKDDIMKITSPKRPKVKTKDK